MILSCTGNTGSRNAGLLIGRKKDRLLKAAQAKATQSGTHKLTFFAWHQALEVQLVFTAR
jgi:hypothetical protein